MEWNHSSLEIKNNIALFTFNNPKQLNALSQNLNERELPEMIRRIRFDEQVKALIITGADGCFSAGGDITGMSRTDEERHQGLLAIHKWLDDLINLPFPVIAAVDGLAYGAGFSIALCADFILATNRSTFCLAFNRIGLVPDFGALFMLPRVLGLQQAKLLAYTAQSITAEQARDLGIVLSLHEPEALMDHAFSLADRFKSGSRTAIGLTKQVLNRSLNENLHMVLELEAEAQHKSRITDYHKDAVSRFLNKKPLLFNWDKMKP